MNTNKIEKKHKEGTPFSLPDNSKSILYQRLEMLQMCIVTKDESTSTSALTEDSLSNSLFESENFVIPQVLRRLPMTGDSRLQQLQLFTSIDSGTGESPPPILKWQVSHPAIVADCRAFKASNPDASYADFIKFYTLLSGPNYILNEELRQLLADIFVVCDPITIEEQKPVLQTFLIESHF